METKKYLGIVALIILLVGGGYVIKDNTYYCEERGIVMECVRFSSSGNRCYPSLVNRKGYRDCNNWQKVEGEIEIEPKIIQSQQQKIGTWVCDNKGCVVK